LPLLKDHMLVINRRRTPRAAANNAAGTVRLLNDVEIEHLTGTAITVLSETHVPRGERMILWAPAEDGGEVTLRVRAVSRQTVVESTLRHRVRFEVDAIGTGSIGARPASGVSAARRLGAIVREVPIRLLEISEGGGLIESPVRLAEGTVGWLSVSGQDAPHQEIVRVCRSDERPERFWRWVSGVEFLTLEPAPAASLRRNMALFTTSGVEANERR
jgi:hypothetical protein